MSENKHDKGDLIMGQAFNPYLPSWGYMPDGEPHVFDGRVYIYGSHDRFNGGGFCVNDYEPWSAAAVIVALLIKGKRRERAAEEETLPAEAAEPAPVQPAPAGLGAAAVGAIVGGAAVPLAVGDWYTRVIYDRSFEVRLIQSDERTKSYYSELKNELMSYKKVTARMSWKHEAFRRGRPTVAKFVFRGKTLCLCLALDPKAYDGSKYIVDDMSDVARFAGTPLLYRIKNDRRLRYAKELIAVLLAEAERVNAAPVNYADIPYEETQPLVERGLIRIVGTERVRYDGNKTAAYADEEEDIAEEVALSEDTGDRRASVSAAAKRKNPMRQTN